MGTFELGSFQSTLMVLYLFPCSQVFRICVPVHLDAHWVVNHLVKVGDSHAGGVEELPPQELAVEGDRRSRMFLLKQRCTRATIIGLEFNLKKPLISTAMTTLTP